MVYKLMCCYSGNMIERVGTLLLVNRVCKIIFTMHTIFGTFIVALLCNEGCITKKLICLLIPCTFCWRAKCSQVYYYVLSIAEYVEQGALFDLLHENEFNPDQNLMWTRQIAAGKCISACHSN